MIVSPLKESCETHFRYTAAGCIFPRNDRQAEAMATIDILDLNIKTENNAPRSNRWCFGKYRRVEL